jgi:hypothetical protein
MARPKTHSRAEIPTVRVALELDEIETLVAISDYYRRSMGPMRHVIRLAASGDVRRRFRFIADESFWLRRFAEATRDSILTNQQQEAPSGSPSGSPRGSPREYPVDLTVPTLVAFWGRILSSLNSPRSRRRLKQDEIARREQLAIKLRDALAASVALDPAPLQNAIATRRPQERAWMSDQLAAGDS